MNWRGVTRGYPQGDEAIRVTDYDCGGTRLHTHPILIKGHMAIEEQEYLMSIYPMLLPYCHNQRYHLLKYLPYQFCQNFGLDQVFPMKLISAILCKDPDMYNHIDKVGENSFVQIARVWRDVLSQNTGIHAI